MAAAASGRAEPPAPQEAPDAPDAPEPLAEPAPAAPGDAGGGAGASELAQKQSPAAPGDAGSGAGAGAGASEEAAQLPRLCAVEIPGLVAAAADGGSAAAEGAVASVGGRVAVAQALAKRDGKLQLKLCRGYRYQAPIPMRRRRTSDVLLRVRRLPDGSWSCEPCGVVDATFSAEALADYALPPGPELAHGASPVMGSIEKELAETSRGSEPYMPPPFFTRVDTPQAYGFEENSFFRRLRKREVAQIDGSGEAKIRRAWVAVRVLRFESADAAPTEPPEGAAEQFRDQDEGFLEAARELFEQRPLWLRGPLEERLVERGFRPNVTVLQKTLQLVAYFWSDGPFRGGYARLGWDPRERRHAQEALWLQVIDFRDRFFRQQRVYFESAQGRRGMGAAEAAPVTALDCHFRTPPVNRSQLYQLADIEDDVVQQTVRDVRPADQCRVDSGWMPLAALRAVRDRLSIRAEVMRRTRKAADAESGALHAGGAAGRLPALPGPDPPAAYEAEEAEAASGSDVPSAKRRATAGGGALAVKRQAP